MKILYLIPARAGSKGLIGKNTKPLNGIPLINHSITIARTIAHDADICVSTESEEIKRIAEDLNLEVPFLRPASLASDTAGMNEVIIHALDFYANKQVFYEAVMLLQPTSPFRKKSHLEEVRNIFQRNPAIEMVVSVCQTHHNPYFSLVEEDAGGHLRILKEAGFHRRQDCPPVYFYNGSIYLISVEAIRKKPLREFTRVKKYVMEARYSVDIDTSEDWDYAEYLVRNNKL